MSDGKITLTQAELDAKIAAAVGDKKFSQADLDGHINRISGEIGSRYKVKAEELEELRKFKAEHEKEIEINKQKELEDRKQYDELKKQYEEKIVGLQKIITDKDGKITQITVSNALTGELVKQGAFIEESTALLQPQTVVSENGEICIKGKDANGIDTQLSIEEGVKQFLAKRPHLVKAGSQGGSGTSGGNAGGGAGQGDDLASLNLQMQEAMHSGDNKRVGELRAKISAQLAKKRA